MLEMKKICKPLLAAFFALLLVLSDAGVALAYQKPEVGKYGMTPIYAQALREGTYEISVDSSSSFFKPKKASITVKDGKIEGSITIGSHSYLYTYLGTKEEAAAADEASWIPFTEDGDFSVFTFPVEALNTPIDCAAFSKKKKKWYDRRLLFDATTLPEDALLIELPDYELIAQGLKALESGGEVTAEAAGTSDSEEDEEPSIGAPVAIEVPYEDGEYSIEVSMTGGTGRAAVSSPTLMIVEDGRAYAKLLWSSSHYDWMKVGSETYYNANTDGGNSFFIIPITEMDRIIEVVADTTAMGDPVAIDYSLTFYADTIGNKGQIPQEAAKKVIILAVIIIVVGGVLNYLVKKKRKK